MKERQRQEELLFDALRQVGDVQARAALLDATCQHDPPLRQRLEQLLSLEAQAENVFSNGAAPVALLNALATVVASGTASGSLPCTVLSAASTDEELRNSSCIGRYKLLQKVGEGGCGTVYMAEQSEPVKRRVALKVIKLGMDTKSVIARFEAERQALALMDHPNIAKVLDAGATDAGRPYFVMELVRGTTASPCRR